MNKLVRAKDLDSRTKRKHTNDDLGLIHYVVAKGTSVCIGSLVVFCSLFKVGKVHPTTLYDEEKNVEDIIKNLDKSIGVGWSKRAFLDKTAIVCLMASTLTGRPVFV